LIPQNLREKNGDVLDVLGVWNFDRLVASNSIFASVCGGWSLLVGLFLARSPRKWNAEVTGDEKQKKKDKEGWEKLVRRPH
jgi:hypothetical protein